MAKRTLDRTRSFARIISNDPNSKVAFEQDAINFDLNGEEVGVTDGYEKLQEKKGKRKALELKEDDRTSQAAALLGDLGLDVHADATRENAAAAAAEDNASA